MPEKDPLSYELATYGWVTFISAWGGLASFFIKIKNGHVVRPSIAEFIGEIVIAGFVGVLTFFVCEAGGINPLLSASFIGISSHMGSRAILLFENGLRRKAELYIGKE